MGFQWHSPTPFLLIDFRSWIEDSEICSFNCQTNSQSYKAVPQTILSAQNVLWFSMDRAQKNEAPQAVTKGLQWCTWASSSAEKYHRNIQQDGQHDHVKDSKTQEMFPVFWLHIPKEKQKIKGKPAAALWTCCWTACSSTDSERLYSTGRQTAWACSVYIFGARDGWWVQLQKDILPQMSSRGKKCLVFAAKKMTTFIAHLRLVMTSVSKVGVKQAPSHHSWIIP